MKKKVISSFLYSNIFGTSYFYKMSAFEMLYKDFSSMLFSYFFLVLFIAILFYLFFYTVEKIFKKKSHLVLEYFAIFFSLICFKAFVYSGDNPYVGHFLAGLDINFNDNFQKIIVLTSILVVFYFFSRFLISKKKSLFDFFQLYSIFLFGLIIYYAIFNKPTIYLVNESEIGVSQQNNKKVPNKRVVLLILDEFDNEILLNNLGNMPAFKKFRSESVFGNNVLSIGNSTLTALPRILTDKNEDYKILATKRKREIFLIDQEGEKIKLNFENSIFKKIPGKENNSAILGKYISYCLIFNKIECEDDMNEILKVNMLFASKIMINELANKLNIKYRISLFDVENFRLNRQLLKFEKFVKKFDKSFVLIHLHLPHLPEHWWPHFPDNLNTAKNEQGNLGEKAILKRYKHNLGLSDQVLKKLLTFLNDGPEEQESLLIITSDHHLRRLSKEPKPIPLIIKLKNDNDRIEIKKNINNLVIHKLIVNYLNNNIDNHRDIQKLLLTN